MTRLNDLVSAVSVVSGPATERPGLTVIETRSLHDGEPMDWWQWGGVAPPSAAAPAHRPHPSAPTNRNIAGGGS